MNLATASRDGFEPAVGIMINAGARPNDPRQFNSGLAPLYWAAKEGHARVMEILLANGANVGWKEQDYPRWTALHVAVANGQTDAVSTLIKHGASLNALASDGDTPLVRAVFCGETACARMLLDAGADASIRSTKYGTAAEIANEKGLTELAATLRDHADGVGGGSQVDAASAASSRVGGGGGGGCRGRCQRAISLVARFISFKAVLTLPFIPFVSRQPTAAAARPLLPPRGSPLFGFSQLSPVAITVCRSCNSPLALRAVCAVCAVCALCVISVACTAVGPRWLHVCCVRPGWHSDIPTPWVVWRVSSRGWAAAVRAVQTEVSRRKNALFLHFLLENDAMKLPRQARDEHKENSSQNGWRSSLSIEMCQSMWDTWQSAASNTKPPPALTWAIAAITGGSSGSSSSKPIDSSSARMNLIDYGLDQERFFLVLGCGHMLGVIALSGRLLSGWLLELVAILFWFIPCILVRVA